MQQAETFQGHAGEFLAEECLARYGLMGARKEEQMVVVQEFEFVDEGAQVLAFPLGCEGAVRGSDMQDALVQAAGWLHERARAALAEGREPGHGEVDHVARRGGWIVAVAIDAGSAGVPAVSASEAARRLGVSPARVAQLCNKQLLDSWRVGSTRMVSVASVDARLADGPKAGRPRCDYARERAAACA